AEAQRNADALAEQVATAQRAADELAQRLATTTETHAGELSESRGKVFALTEELATVRNDLAALEQQQEQTVGQQRTELDQARQTLAEVRTEFSAATAAAAREKQALEGQIADAQGRIAALERDLETEHSRAVQGLAEAQQKSEETLAAQRKQFEEARVADPQVQAPGPALVQSPTATQTQGLVDRYAQLQAQQTDRGMLVSLAEQQLHFASGGTSLPKGAIPSLDQIAALLKEFPNLAAVIEGHTDSSGPDTVNLTLSKARAESVRQGLIARGVAPQRLTATGLGEAKPVADNTTAPGRLKNRRVEILVIEPAP
ncbi:MAG TPA: OmpA family protein, partial [Lamprocystis sp. (in: g-proteobacteria)]|nr:OmpA family protein [Lamprocystis sp. (in: g-proteobacteria)]